MHFQRAHDIPEFLVSQELRLGKGGFPELGDRLLDLWALQQGFRNLVGLLVDLGQVTQPEHLHLLVPVVVRGELGQLDEDKAQSLDYLAGVLCLHDFIVVVIFRAFREGVVDKVERVDLLEFVVVRPDFQLADVGFRGVEQHALLIVGGPHHLHLHDELASLLVAATHVHDAVLAQGVQGHKLGVQVFHHIGDLLFRLLEW